MRSSNNPTASICLQERDIEILRGLFESRVMTVGHAASLYFDGSREAAKKRMQKLKAANLVAERARRAFEPSVLYLTGGGLAVLQEHGILTEYPWFDLPVLERRARVSDLTLRHELEVMDVKTAFHVAIRQAKPFSIVEFSTWPRLHEFEAAQGGMRTLVKPDGFLRIHESESGGELFEHAFFLELDRSSETQDTLVSRATAYLDYYSSGGFAAKNGAARTAFKEYPFRVLMVFKTAERRNNTAKRLLRNNPPILTQVCLATVEAARKDPFGPIWFRPLDYRVATSGTAFDPEKNLMRDWQRRPEREIFVEANVPKRLL